MPKIIRLLLCGIVLVAASVARAAESITQEVEGGTLYGTLELPASKGPWPVALFLSGSGATNRDGNSIGGASMSNGLRLLAEALARRGIASVRYDRRRVGASFDVKPYEESAHRFERVAADAVAWGQKLRADKRFSALAIVGHSEGATVGMAAALALRPQAYVSLAGPGRRFGEAYLDQIKPDLTPEQFAQAQAVVANWNEGKATEVLPAPLDSFFRFSVQPYLISIHRFDPARRIRDLSSPTLIVAGTTDLQVPVSDARLLSAASPNARLVVIEKMNHVLKSAEGDAAAQLRSYLDPALPVVPRLVDEVARFVHAAAKAKK